MKQVFIFGGTTEGRELAENLSALSVPCVVSVASEYGKLVMGTLSVAGGGVRLRDYLRLMMIPALFLALGTIAILIQFGSGSGETLARLRFFSGYLYITKAGLTQSLNLVCKAFGAFSALFLLTLSTPMADNGKLYAGFTPEFAKAMAGLCAKADVIVPNLTEASFLLDIPYPGETYTRESIREILVNLTKLGAKKAVLTGISFAEKELGAVAYDSETDSFIEYFNEKLPVSFHGTGDIFASVCVGALLNGFDLEKALTLSVDYTLEAMRYTMKDPDHRWYGVNFESAIPMLVKRLEKEK